MTDLKCSLHNTCVTNVTYVFYVRYNTYVFEFKYVFYIIVIFIHALETKGLSGRLDDPFHDTLSEIMKQIENRMKDSPGEYRSATSFTGMIYFRPW